MPKDPANLYATEQEEQNEGWMIIKLQLLLKDWRFADFEVLMKSTDPLFYIEEKIKQRHPRSLNMQISLDEEQNNILLESNDKLGKIFNTKGDKSSKDAKTYNLYYDFEPGAKNPLLLFIKD